MSNVYSTEDEDNLLLLHEAHQKFSLVRSQIEALLPLYTALLGAIRARSIISMEDQDYSLAQHHRKTLLDLFALVEKCAKSPLPAGNDAQRIHASFVAHVVHFLQGSVPALRMLPLPTREIVSEFLGVLDCQIAHVDQEVRDATARRRFEDVGALKESLAELHEAREQEIARLQALRDKGL